MEIVHSHQMDIYKSRLRPTCLTETYLTCADFLQCVSLSAKWQLSSVFPMDCCSLFNLSFSNPLVVMAYYISKWRSSYQPSNTRDSLYFCKICWAITIPNPCNMLLYNSLCSGNLLVRFQWLWVWQMCVFFCGVKLYGQQPEGWILVYSRNFVVLVLGALMCDM